MRSPFFSAIADFERLDMVDECSTELVVDRFVDIDTFCAHTDLTGVHEREESDLWYDFLDVDVGAYNCWIIATSVLQINSPSELVWGATHE